jgi:hypothetical protein
MFTTVEKILPVAAAFYGKQVRVDRAFLLQKINEVRTVWWKSEAMREVYFKRVDCSCVREHRSDCNPGCKGDFKAITLPHGVSTVQNVTWNGRRVPVSPVVENRDPWRYAGGPDIIWDGRQAIAERLTQKFCLEQDIPRNYQGVVVIRNLDGGDNGKKVGVRYISPNGDIVREDVQLNISGYETTQTPLKFLEITLPVRCGFVEFLTADGYLLGAYHPSINAPSHVRIRVDGCFSCCSGQVVEWEGIQEPYDVMFDTDRVEMDAVVDWRNGFQSLDLHFRTNKSGAETQAYQDSIQFASGSADSALKSEQTIPVAHLRPRGIRRILRKTRWLERWP